MQGVRPSILALVVLIVVAAGGVLVLFRPSDSPPPSNVSSPASTEASDERLADPSEEPSEQDTTTTVDPCGSEERVLGERVFAMEEAFFSRSPDMTVEGIRAELSKYLTPALLEGHAVGSAGAAVQISDSTVTSVRFGDIDPCNIGIGFSPDGTIAYVTHVFNLERRDLSGELLTDPLLYHETQWRKIDGLWLVETSLYGSP